MSGFRGMVRNKVCKLAVAALLADRDLEMCLMILATPLITVIIL